MSAFSSLLNQFKETTQQAVVSQTEKKRPHSAIGDGNHQHHHPRHTYNNNKYSGIQASSASQQPQLSKQWHRLPSTPVRSIFIACPAFAETGGPEALHQLCHMINTGKYPILSRCPGGAAINDLGDNKIVDGERDHDNSHPEVDEFGRESKNRHDVITDTDHPLRRRGREADGDNEALPTLRAYMLYLRETTKSGRAAVEHIQSTRARPSKYDKYLAPPAPKLPGSTASRPAPLGHDSDGEYSSDLVIWPECWTQLIDSIQPTDDSFSRIDNDNHGELRSSDRRSCNNSRRLKHQIAIWWLSVNNNNGQFTPEQFATRHDVLHLAQSAYAHDYVSTKLQRGVRKKGVGENDDDCHNNNLLTLTEFIPYSSPTFCPITSDDIKNCDIVIATPRDLDVVYNPAKGMHYTDEIIRRMCGGGGGGKRVKTQNWNDGGGSSGVEGSIRFTPIGKGVGGRERMTGEEVVDLLRRSKVYIDFGPHPGMDRLPREAALAGTIVITNCEGAANFHEDVPLPSAFKFRTFDVDRISSILRDCCINYATYVGKMKSYREWILGQEKEMVGCVDRLVERVVTRRTDKNAE